MSLPQDIDAEASPEVQMNENALSQQWAFCYGNDPRDNDLLDRGYSGGRWGGFTISDVVHAFGASVTTYVSVAVADGSLNFSTSNTNFNDTTNYKRVEVVVTGASAVTGVTDYRGGPGGVHGSGAAGGSGGTELKGLTFTSETGSTADSDPGAGLFKWNNATQASATFLYFDDLTLDAVSLATYWASLGGSGFIYLQQSDDATKWQLWKWTSSPTDGTGYRKFPVTLQASGGSIADNKTTYCLFSGTSSSSGTAGKHSIPIVAGAMRPSVTGGCAALAAIASAANQPDIVTLDFDPTTQEYAQFSVPTPKSWNEGTVTFQAIWSHPATTTNFGVVWDLQAIALSDDDAIAQAFGSAQTSTDTGGTTNDIYISPESSAITIAGTPAAQDVVFFRLSRVTGNGSDTMAVDARLHGIVLFITTDAENDA